MERSPLKLRFRGQRLRRSAQASLMLNSLDHSFTLFELRASSIFFGKGVPLLELHAVAVDVSTASDFCSASSIASRVSWQDASD